MAKYHATANKAYLDDGYRTLSKLLDRIPYVAREGMRIQLEHARQTKSGEQATLDDVIDDSIEREIEKEGFIERLYR